MQVDLKVGDRVAVRDEGLARLRAIMQSFGKNVPPNNIGVIDRIEDGDALIIFDDGQMAPYPLEDCEGLHDGRGQ